MGFALFHRPHLTSPRACMTNILPPPSHSPRAWGDASTDVYQQLQDEYEIAAAAAAAAGATAGREAGGVQGGAGERWSAGGLRAGQVYRQFARVLGVAGEYRSAQKCCEAAIQCVARELGPKHAWVWEIRKPEEKVVGGGGCVCWRLPAVLVGGW